MRKVDTAVEVAKEKTAGPKPKKPAEKGLVAGDPPPPAKKKRTDELNKKRTDELDEPPAAAQMMPVCTVLLV